MGSEEIAVKAYRIGRFYETSIGGRYFPDEAERCFRISSENGCRRADERLSGIEARDTERVRSVDPARGRAGIPPSSDPLPH